MVGDYNGGLTREQFLFYEIRTVATLLQQGLSRNEILEKIKQENLFQFPTERMISSIANTCFKRIDALESETLVYPLANAPADVAKQINLYAMMKYNRIVWDFMTTVIAEKFRTQEFDFSKKDLNVFFFRLQEQNDSVASWSDSTINKIKQVLTRTLVECEYLDSIRATQLNSVTIAPELEDELRTSNEKAALAAFKLFFLKHSETVFRKSEIACEPYENC
ncbi:MAG: DUF1819 family protein [Clostridia bacterium]|nr:DUF1819 family protein [Clostridia bacterium]